MLCALAAFVAAPIALSVEVAAFVEPGERVQAVVFVKNLTQKPVILIEPRLPNVRLGMRFWSELQGPNGAVFKDYDGPMIGQFFTTRRIEAQAFFKPEAR